MDRDYQENKGNILVTGASGFVGSFLVEEGLSRGYRVFAGVRSTSSRKLLDRLDVEQYPFDFTNWDDVALNLRNYRDHGIQFDYVIHAAAVTKPKKIEEFYSGNAEFTRFFANTLKQEHKRLKKFVFISSMAALGPGNEKTFQPITEQNVPNPFTPYGQSKRKAEIYLQDIEELNYVIFRPTAVYGPRDRKFLLRVMDMMKRGFEVRIGSPKQRSSFLYVKDLVGFIFSSLEKEAVQREVFNVSDGQNYSQIQLNEVVKNALGTNPFPIRIPRWAMMAFSYGLLAGNQIIRRPLHLSPYKVREITALNWIIDISKAKEQLQFTPKYNLESGIIEAVEWFQTR